MNKQDSLLKLIVDYLDLLTSELMFRDLWDNDQTPKYIESSVDEIKELMKEIENDS